MYKYLFLILLIFAGCATEAAAVDVTELTPVLAIPPAPVQIAEPFTFEFRGTTINLNQNIAEVLPSLGEPLGIHETPSCAFEGYDRIFRFSGVQLHTFPQGDHDYIQIISLWDDSVSTEEGVYIGASWDNVVSSYGTNYVQEFNKITFTRSNTTLSFYVQNNTVIEITYALIF